MNADSILDTVLGQLAIEDPAQFGDVQNRAPGDSVPPLIELIQRILKDVVEAHHGEVDADVAIGAAAVLAQTGEMLLRASASLWRAGVFAESGRPDSPLMASQTPEGVAAAYAAYVEALKAMAAMLKQSRLEPIHLPIMEQNAEEIRALPTVFEFLATRRSRLRRHIHPGVCQYGVGGSTAEMGADRADELVSFYNTNILSVDLVEEPECWTMRDKPEFLRRGMRDILCDLHHLADAGEINWREILAEGLKNYKDELRG